MSSIGPQIPAELSKRKRTPDEDDRAGPHPMSPPTKQIRTNAPATNNDEIDLGDSDSDSDDMGPKAPAASASARSVGPTLPPSTANNEEINLDSDSDSDTGPAPAPPPPPQAAAAAPAVAPTEGDTSSDSEDDGYGPVLPSAPTAKRPTIGPSLPPTEQAPQRDSWMVAPPEASGGYKERDPTRMKNRKFASKPSTSSNSGISSMWTETPEEKLKRQRDALLGRSAGPDGSGPDSADNNSSNSSSKREQEERDRRIAASIEAKRGRSLYDEHSDKRKNGKDKRKPEEEEDDPSKRAFDREKDMALGGKIGTAQRRELVTKAANFGGRFQKGSFL